MGRGETEQVRATEIGSRDVHARKAAAVLTTFDRYLLKRYFHTFAICFITAMGVFFVFDAFTNADEFQKASPDGSVWPVVRRMALYYSCQSSLLLSLVGHMLCVLAVMISLVSVQRTGELHPVLAAGVPLYRIILPLVMGAVVVNVAMIANQEWMLPRVAHVLKTPKGRQVEQGIDVRPSLDFATHVLISARRVYPASSRLEAAEFVLPVPDVVTRLTTLRAQTAKFVRAGPGGRSGWLVAGLKPDPQSLALGPMGHRVVRAGPRAGMLFIVSGVTPEQLSEKAGHSRFLSTSELLRQVRNPSQAARAAHEQALEVHARLTRPLLNIAAVFLAVPFLVRRESRGVVANLAIAGGVMLAVLGAGEACLYLASFQVMAPDVAAWSPVVACGMGATWCARHAET